MDDADKELLKKLKEFANVLKDCQKRHDEDERLLGRYKQCSCELCCLVEKYLK